MWWSVFVCCVSWQNNTPCRVCPVLWHFASAHLSHMHAHIHTRIHTNHMTETWSKLLSNPPAAGPQFNVSVPHALKLYRSFFCVCVSASACLFLCSVSKQQITSFDPLKKRKKERKKPFKLNQMNKLCCLILKGKGTSISLNLGGLTDTGVRRTAGESP